MVRFTAVRSVVTVGGFAAGLPWGIKGVATAYLAVTVVMQPLFVWLTTREVGIGPGEWVRAVGGVVAVALVMLAAVLGAREALAAADLPALPRLLALLATGAAVYVPLVAWRVPELPGRPARAVDAPARRAAGGPRWAAGGP